MTKLIKLTIIMLLVPFVVSATGGISALPFLKLGISPEVEAKAGVFWGARDGAFNLWYNPANLAQGLLNTSFSYRQWLEEISLMGFQVKFPVYTGGFGLGIIRHDLGTIQSFDEFGVAGPELSPNEFAIALGFGSFLKVPEGLACGIAVKYAKSDLIENEIANALLADIGLNFEKYGICLGAVVKNIGTDIESGSRKDPPPTEFHFGGSIPATIQKDLLELQIGADVTIPLEGDFRFGVGAELNAYEFIHLRGGYKGGSDLESLTAGVGLSWSNICFDYAYGAMENGDPIHMVSLSASFDGYALSPTSTYSEKKTDFKPTGTTSTKGILESISYDVQTDYLTVYLDYSGACEYRDFSLSDPRRIILDLMGLEGMNSAKSMDINQLGVDKIRAAKHDNYIRVVIDISGAENYRIIQLDQQIQIQIQ
jgi:hypothetical protein